MIDEVDDFVHLVVVQPGIGEGEVTTPRKDDMVLSSVSSLLLDVVK